MILFVTSRTLNFMFNGQILYVYSSKKISERTLLDELLNQNEMTKLTTLLHKRKLRFRII